MIVWSKAVVACCDEFACLFETVARVSAEEEDIACCDCVAEDPCLDVSCQEVDYD
jgi:hypothetical protein